MSETPITPDEPDIPEEPLGVPEELDPDDAPLPGFPESEPPQAD